MPTELEDLVSFLHSDQPAVKQIALQNLVGFSQGAHQQVFAYDDYRSIKDLKILAQDQGKTTVSQSVTILANLCDDITMRDLIVKDDAFVEFLVFQICNLHNSNADLMCILLTNLAKNDQITKIFQMTRDGIANDTEGIFKSKNAIDCLMDCFVKGFDRSLNKYAEYDYLSYFFADISRLLKGREYFTTEQAYDEVVPLSKLLVFTEKYDSKIRREGVASTIKNSLFETKSHMKFLTDEKINLLPYILLPIAGPEEIDEDDMFNLPDELQLLASDKKRDPASEIIATHLESILLLCTTKEAREYLREKAVYAIIKELHKNVTDELVEELCDRIVQLLMRDDAPTEEEIQAFNSEDESEEDDDKIVEIV